MAKTLGTIGTELNIKFRQGATFGKYRLTIKNSSGLPVDLTAHTFTGNIKKSYAQTTALATISVSPVDLVNGVIELSIPAETTALIKGNPNGLAEYIWDFEMTDSNGHVDPVFYGTVESYSNV